MEDITDFLAFEVKKDMADRYFGFRKRIEGDTAAYRKRLALSSIELENEIGFGLIRIYILLGNEQLISSFLLLVGLPANFFYDPYFLSSPTIQTRVFAGRKCRGLTRNRRFFNMFFDCYRLLDSHIETYHKTLAELTEEHQTIREQINLFYRNNDIDSIMSFIRRLDSPDVSEQMLSGSVQNSGSDLAGQLRLHPPLPACDMLPPIPSLPSLTAIRPQLKKILTEALHSSVNIDLRTLTSHSS